MSYIKHIIKKLIDSTKYSIAGLKAAFQTGESFRLETVSVILLIPIGFFIGRSIAEKMLLIGVLFIILIVELLNSGIETAIDRIGMEYNDLSKRAKDIASAAVFLSICLAAIVWGCIIFFG